MDQRLLIKVLREEGYYEIRHSGRHLIFEKPGYPHVQIPKHREISTYTARDILKLIGRLDALKK